MKRERSTRGAYGSSSGRLWDAEKRSRRVVQLTRGARGASVVRCARSPAAGPVAAGRCAPHAVVLLLGSWHGARCSCRAAPRLSCVSASPAVWVSTCFVVESQGESCEFMSWVVYFRACVWWMQLLAVFDALFQLAVAVLLALHLALHLPLTMSLYPQLNVAILLCDREKLLLSDSSLT